MLRIGNITLDCADPARVADFWAAALGWPNREGDASGEAAWAAVTGGAGQPRLHFQRVPEGKTVKNRLHLDLNATDGDMAGEVARLEGLGARRGRLFDEPGDVWTTMFDPEGNEFCVQPD